jgi:hypothetical protein
VSFNTSPPRPPPELTADPKGLGAVVGVKSMPAKNGLVIVQKYEHASLVLQISEEAVLSCGATSLHVFSLEEISGYLPSNSIN